MGPGHGRGLGFNSGVLLAGCVARAGGGGESSATSMLEYGRSSIRDSVLFIQTLVVRCTLFHSAVQDVATLLDDCSRHTEMPMLRQCSGIFRRLRVSGIVPRRKPGVG